MRNYFTAFLISLSLLDAGLQAEWYDFESCFNHVGASTFAGFESFRGIPDADWGDNNGVHAGLELAFPVPYLDKYLIGFQIGGSYGAYNFSGQNFSSKHSRSIQSQEFFTAGLFVRAQQNSPLSIGIVYDWMFNQNFGIYAEDPCIQQVRGQVAYVLTPCDEVGIWGTYDTNKSYKKYRIHGYGYNIIYRAISQVNFFWRHFYGCGVESTLWIGTPTRNRLNKENSDRPGKYILGCELAVPFFDSWSLIGRACYMQAGTKCGSLAAREYTSNIVFNLVYHFGGNPISERRTSAWSPYVSIGNNSNFFVDAAVRSAKSRPLMF